MGLGNDSRLRRYDDLRDMIGDPENPTPIVALQSPRPRRGDDALRQARVDEPVRLGQGPRREVDARGDGASAASSTGEAIVEPTSGNTGIALAAMAALMDVPMTVTVPWNLPVEKDVLLRMLGAEVIRTPQTRPVRAGTRWTSRSTWPRSSSAFGDDYVMPNQYDNPDNVRAHYETTGPEIWAQTEGTRALLLRRARHRRARSTGVGRFLKEQDPSRSASSRSSRCRATTSRD